MCFGFAFTCENVMLRKAVGFVFEDSVLRYCEGNLWSKEQAENS